MSENISPPTNDTVAMEVDGGDHQVVEKPILDKPKNSTSSQSSSTATAQTQRHGPDAVETHKKFIACLEAHGSSSVIEGQEWKLMAKEMNWTENEVKLYAYQYMKALFQEDNDDHFVVDVDDDDSENNEEEKEWTWEETVLFDNLLVLHPKSKYAEKNHDLSWEEVIASFLPDKSPEQVIDRFEKLYRCK